MLEVECPFEPPHTHTYPDDWIFGGADGTHPGADSRFESNRYYYYNDKFDLIYVTSVPLCMDEAIDHFTFVANLGGSYNPVYIGSRAPEESVPQMLPFRYDKSTDQVWEITGD